MPVSSLRKLRLHIGHDFFGSGNLGDDLTLAGFLSALSECGTAIELTCASAFDAASQIRRFAQLQWIANDPDSLQQAIASCDAWVGVGDTPFQIVVGPTMLDHLVGQCEVCLRYSKPMYFIGIGVNEAEALEDSRSVRILQQAEHVWTRDKRSAELIAPVAGPARVSPAADLANAWLKDWKPNAIERQVIGYCLNFEKGSQFSPRAIAELISSQRDLRQCWLVQEVRELAGSERTLLASLPTSLQRLLELRLPSYSAPSLAQMLAEWRSPDQLISSRYHALLVGAWAGSRVLAIERSEKIRGLIDQLDLSSATDLTDAAVVRSALESARRVSPDRLDVLAEKAVSSCRQMIDIIDQRPAAALASVQSMNSRPFRSFIEQLNNFAGPLGLRTFLNWSKIWEYPWLWHAALGRVNWSGRAVIDLGSELSPMPWYLATIGAKVTLIETDPQWIERWTKLRDELGVNISWHIVTSERIPEPDASADVVTSFSVIEHQPDKTAAVNEVVRVLRPGGMFAVSFDICEEHLGMSFPAWNGRALSIAEFEELIWLYPGFRQTTRPRWNRDDIDPFLKWHRTTAPHHNYVVGAAVLYKSTS